jgi:uncharacterized membrane protein
MRPANRSFSPLQRVRNRLFPNVPRRTANITFIAVPTTARRRLVLGGAAAGAALSYLFDPQHGARRRAVLQNRLTATLGQSRTLASKGIRDLSHRGQGLVAEAGALFRREPVPDDVLAERVRARVGHLLSHPVDIACEDGRIVLSGPVLADEAQPLLALVKDVRGVRTVEDRLQVYERPEGGEAGGVPGLQGAHFRGHRRFSRSPAGRLLLGIAGFGLLGRGLLRRGLAGSGLSLVGTAALARAASGRPLGELLGFVGPGGRVGRAGGAPIEVHKSIVIESPRAEAFAYFADFRNLPRFMSHIEEVRVGQEGRSHWVAIGPAGTTCAWEAQVTRLDEGRVIAWRSLPGSELDTSGQVTFEDTPEGFTRLNVVFRYRPFGGGLGHLLAVAFGKDPKSALDEDLLRFKSLMEEGRARAHHRPVERAELDVRLPPS